MGLAPLVTFNNAHLKHGHKCPRVPTSGEGTWWGHGGDMVGTRGHRQQSPVASKRGSGNVGGGRGHSPVPGSVLCPSAAILQQPSASSFQLPQREFAESFPGGNTGCGRGRARPAEAGGDGPSGTAGRAGNVLVATRHPVGSPGLLGMETLAGGGGLGPQHGAGAQACSIPTLLGRHFPAQRCWLGTGAPTPCTNLDHSRGGETEARLESGPGSDPAGFPTWCRPAPSCSAGRVPGPAAGFGVVLPGQRAQRVAVGQRRVGTMSHPHCISQGAQPRTFNCIHLQHL